MDTLLIVGSGSAAYREYVLRSLAAHYELVLLHDFPITWQKPYVKEYICAPLTRHTLAISVARQLQKRYRFAGVFTYSESFVELAAAIAQALQFPHTSVDSMRHCRDKALMRRAWQAAHVPSAVSHLVTSTAEAKAVAEEMGYPVVVKPRALSGSFGVIRVDSSARLVAAYAAAEQAHALFGSETTGVLVEEYLAGPEVSVESVVSPGHIQCVAITRKQTGFAPYFEEIGHLVSPQEPLAEETEIRRVVEAAHRALGIERGVTHAELRLTSRGPRMIEIGARLAGDFIPELVLLATGIDIIQAGAELALGRFPILEPSRQLAAGVHFIYPLQDGKVLSLEADLSITNLPGFARVNWLATPGDEVQLPPRNYLSRLAGIVVFGATCAECRNRVASALDLLQIHMVPLDERENVAPGPAAPGSSPYVPHIYDVWC